MCQVLWCNIPSFAAETEIQTFENSSKTYQCKPTHFYCIMLFVYTGNCKTRFEKGKIQLPFTHA